MASGALLADLEAETVDFIPNFDASVMEPTVLPARVPNLLINGSSGIAVGIATKIPPHNMAEVVAGLKAYIRDPSITSEALMKYIPAPDFPTGNKRSFNLECSSVIYLIVLRRMMKNDLFCRRGNHYE